MLGLGHLFYLTVSLRNPRRLVLKIFASIELARNFRSLPSRYIQYHGLGLRVAFAARLILESRLRYGYGMAWRSLFLLTYQTSLHIKPLGYAALGFLAAIQAIALGSRSTPFLL